MDNEVADWLIPGFEGDLDLLRMRRARLARVQDEMAKADLGALLLYEPANVAYVTRTQHSGEFLHRFYANYVLVPQHGVPTLFEGFLPEYESAPEDGSFRVREGLTWDYFPTGTNVVSAVDRWAGQVLSHLRELGVGVGERLGFDRMDFHGVNALQSHGVSLADARIPIEKARAVKTMDELTVIQYCCAIADIAVTELRDAIRPGVTENELFAVLVSANLRHGGHHMDCRLVLSGDNTKPWFRPASNRQVRDGELVALDTDMAGPMGYFADISRTYLCGDSEPTKDQFDAYRVAYEFIQEALPIFQPGARFEELAGLAPQPPEEYRATRYPFIAHGAGMSDEWPSVHFPDVGETGFSGDLDVVQENMVLCIEFLASKTGARECVKLEEQFIVRDNGPEVISFAPHDMRLLGAA